MLIADDSEFRELLDAFETKWVPKSIAQCAALRLIDADANPAAISAIFRKVTADREHLQGKGAVQSYALIHLHFLCRDVAECRHALDEGNLELARAHLNNADRVRNQLDGFLMAMQLHRYDGSNRAISARKKVGATTRDRVRAAAQKHRLLQRSRFNSAPLIAEEVRLSSSRVLRLLSELFPGDDWKNLG